MIVKPLTIPIRHNGIRYLPNEAFEIDTESYARIAGHVEVVQEDAPHGLTPQVFDFNKPLDKITVPEMKAFAELNQIDLGDAKKKEEIFVVIESELKKRQAEGGDNQGGGAGDQQDRNPDADKA